MAKYLHLFETEDGMWDARWNEQQYSEPWVAANKENEIVSFNISPSEYAVK